MDAAPVHLLKVLGILTGTTTDAVVHGEQQGLGAIEEVFDLPETRAQVGDPWNRLIMYYFNKHFVTNAQMVWVCVLWACVLAPWKPT